MELRTRPLWSYSDRWWYYYYCWAQTE